MEIRDRIEELREAMKEHHMDVYVIPTADYHDSEYVGPYFKCREYMTGFTGSAGTAVITHKEACLWTDGRYFVQAGKELEGSGISLMRMGEEGIPTLEEYLEKEMPKDGILGFDGKTVNAKTGEQWEECVKKRGGSICSAYDLAGDVWKERPAMSAEPIWILNEKYAGKGAKKKLEELRKEMEQAGASVHILTILDDIAWLFNIRGNDIPCNPVALSYFIMTKEKNILFIQKKALNETAEKYFAGLEAEVRPYEEFYDFAASIHGEKILLEKGKINVALWKSLDPSNAIIDRISPCTVRKAIKNPIEIENIRKAHIKDGVAVTKFIYWLKKNAGRIHISEISAADYLEELRRRQEGYLGPSFDTISAYGPNAAMCHYSATKESNAEIKARGLYLVDSGGQYYEGTTDITRTIALGELTDEERLHFTLTVIGMLRLGNMKFLYGCTGVNLDYAAREPFWQRGLNFNHGTGHGVGYLLNVHERPNSIRWKVSPSGQDPALEEGMLTSDEPGIYVEGSHGIRTENLMLCHKGEKNEYGQFMKFEFVTCVPIDLDALDLSVMEDKDICLLNQYHRAVWEKISPFLEEKEREWLQKYTREVSR